ncbi:MAG: DUF3137 domain-containing protein, partial [Tannerellaceae bacterium]|nr:DUF3137 domain-containing protein [Tannerellaceae bacterium]
LIGGGGFYIWYSSSSVCEEYKRTIIAPFAENLVENGIYSPTEGIQESTFLKSNLYQTPDRYNSEDLIKGKIGQTSILFSEVHAEEKYQTTDSKGNTKTHWRDIFRGFMFVADFPKEFEVPITIKRKKLFASKKNRVFLEDPEFEKCFNVYCNDQIQARYILTASLMRRIMDLERKFHGKKMMLSFHDNNVIITIQEKTNHYEAGLWRSVIRNKKLRREYEIIRAFALIVEDLNLNLRIWTKQV